MADLTHNHGLSVWIPVSATRTSGRPCICYAPHDEDCRCRLPGSLPATPLWHALPDDAELLVTLTAASCPAPCIGRRDPEGEDWHAGCEQRATEALRVLRGWATS